jgi:hypothetical protein
VSMLYPKTSERCSLQPDIDCHTYMHWMMPKTT